MSHVITLQQYWHGNEAAHGHLLTPELRANAQRTVDATNELLGIAVDGGVMLTPGQYGMVRSGWRPPAINAATKGASKTSRHMTCEAIDVEDPYGLLAAWVYARWKTVLTDVGMWMEHPTASPTWFHGQTVAHASFAKTGLRYFYP